MKVIIPTLVLTLGALATAGCRDEYNDRDRDLGSRTVDTDRDRDDRAPDWKIDDDLDIPGNPNADSARDDEMSGVDEDLDSDVVLRDEPTPGDRDTLPVPGNFGRTTVDWSSHRGNVNFLVGSEGFETADRLNKPVFVYYTEQGCRPCEDMAGTAFKDPRVTDLIARNFVPVLVDVRSTDGDDEDWVDKHSAAATPKIVFADDDGDVVTSLEGAQSADAILAAANDALARMTDTASR